jgi:PAS domain S-box-containing protein
MKKTAAKEMENKLAGINKVVSKLEQETADFKELKEMQERLVAIFEKTPDIIWNAKADGTLAFINESARVFFGISEDAHMSSFNITQAYPNWTENYFQHELLQRLEEEEFFGEESVVKDLHGQERTVSQVVIGHRSGEGAITHVSAILHDITKAKEHLQRAIKRKELTEKLVLAIEDILTETSYHGLFRQAALAAKEITDAEMGLCGIWRERGLELIGLPPAKETGSPVEKQFFGIGKDGAIGALLKKSTISHLNNDELSNHACLSELLKLDIQPHNLIGRRIEDENGKIAGFILALHKLVGGFTAEDKQKIFQLAVSVSLRLQQIRAKKSLFEEVADKKEKLVRTENELRSEVVRREGVEELIEKAENRIRKLAQKIIDVQEMERKKVAQDIHDRVGGKLTAIKFGVEKALREKIAESDSADGFSLKEVAALVQDTIEATRRACRQLRPVGLDDLGLLRIMKGECQRFDAISPDLQVVLDLDTQEEDVPDELKIVIFRIIQETLNNIAKHSQAKKAHISLVKENNTLSLEIKDDGFRLKKELLFSHQSFFNGISCQSRRGMQVQLFHNVCTMLFHCSPTDT